MLVGMGKERLCESDSYYADTTQLATVVVRVDITMRLQDFINYSNTMKHSDYTDRLQQHSDEIDADETQQKVERSTTDEILGMINSDDEVDRKTGEQLLDREVAKARDSQTRSSGEIAKAYVERYKASTESKKRVQQLAKTQLDI